MRARLDRDLLDAELRHRLYAHVLLQRDFDVVHDRRVERVELAPRLFDRRARPEPPEQVQPVARAIVEPLPARDHQPTHRHRDEHERSRAERCPVEILRCNTNDGHRLTIDHDLVADHGRIRTEVALPVRVAQHGDKIRSDGLVIPRRQEPSERRTQAEH